MIDLIRKKQVQIVVWGIHAQIIQSILDFDFISGSVKPSIVGIIGINKHAHKCWFGDKEILLPVFADIGQLKKNRISANWLLNLLSENSALRGTELFFENYPEAIGAHIFAEGVSEQDSLLLVEKYGSSKIIAGASGVGLMLPSKMKLGAIGGIFGMNINMLGRVSGSTAVICSSGGMVNEIIDTLLHAGGAPSFAVSYGGERFPITSPVQWCLYAESDPDTDQIVFFGELGGLDEYQIVEAIKTGRINKPVIAYIAGQYIDDNKKIQFGHAKALAKNPNEDAASKIDALAEVGVIVSASYAKFIDSIKTLPHKRVVNKNARDWTAPDNERNTSLFTAVHDRGSDSDGFVRHSLCTLLESESVSDELVEFVDLAYSILIDHGAEVSGAINTMITARAGKDMVSALASGLLTIGNRFGGAINGAADNWFTSVCSGISVENMLEMHKLKGQYVLGIGHLKYSLYKPDKRVEKILSFSQAVLSQKKHIRYALATAERTTQKKPNLILNVDGVIAAAFLDILVEKEGLTEDEIKELIRIEFFNSIFIISRTVGFIGNYLTQQRRDEGLFRMPPEQVFYE